ncbi:MAG: HIT domain-containing protein [Ktedonobacterales bacterium]
MQHLWAPWRMTYIGGSGEQEAGCIFCVKPQQDRDEENLLLYRGERCFVIMNLYPYNNGHLMIAPYAHVPGIQQLDAPTLTEIMETAQLCLAALTAAMGPQGFNMGINQGAVAGAGIADHTHFHIVPRWNGDTNFMPVLADVKVMPDFLNNTWRQIRQQLIPMVEQRKDQQARHDSE